MSPAEGAVRRVERILAGALAVSRFGGTAMLALVVLSVPPDNPRFAPVAGLSALAAAEGLVLVVACWRAGRVRRAWVATDVAFVLALLCAGAAVPAAGGMADGSVFYNYALFTSVTVGLPRQPMRYSIGGGALLALSASAVEAFGVDHPYPLWNIVPNAVGFPVLALVACVLAWQLRTAADQIDTNRDAAARAGAALATERERASQAAVLRARLLGALDGLAEPGALADGQMRAHVAAEVEWLRGLVDGGAHTPPDSLLGALRTEVEDRSARGVPVALEVVGGNGDAISTATTGEIEAVAGAVREALTNVAKHAGAAAAAAVRVGRVSGRITVEVVDDGKGFDPAACGRGLGLAESIGRRVAEAGGRVEIDSAPGAGTTVRISVPARAATGATMGAAAGAAG
jgi:hypothetical protein